MYVYLGGRDCVSRVVQELVIGGNVCICTRCVYVMGLKLDIKVVCLRAPFCLLQSGPFMY